MSITPSPSPRRDQEQHDPGPEPGPSWWKQATGKHGCLTRRLNDLQDASTYGWPKTATWIKTLLAVAAFTAVALALRWAGTLLIQAGHALPWPITAIADPTGLLATIDHPVRHYLDTHTAALPVSATTTYATWQAVGAASFILGCLRSTGARLTWTAWGAATVAMVWAQTPATGREVATGLAVLAWTSTSTLALRGLSLRPVLVTR
ncbi:hypothetical protein ACH4FE_35700 [Streptomyces celluloflavus]|uniref:hypothetical protein n=1 Tax=Streptomyces celluloflavus TaxID=58344 RepID=UPI0037A7CD36